MPTVAELIAGRLIATGMDDAIARRMTDLILRDLRLHGYGLVETLQIDFLTNELIALQSNLKILADAWVRVERALPAPKGSR